MTGPARPVYLVTVTNVDQDWTFTAEEGETPPALEDVTAFLTDDFNLDWGLEGDQLPAPLRSDVASFKLYCRTAADVPAIEPGDIILANLDRVGPDDELIPYMHFVGRATDPDADTTPRRGVVLTVGAIGMILDFTGEYDYGAPDPSESQSAAGQLEALLGTTIDDLGAGFAQRDDTILGPLGVRQTRPFGKRTLQEHVDRLLASSISASPVVDYAVLRYAFDWIAQQPESGDDPFPEPYGYNVDNNFGGFRLFYYLQAWLLTLPAPLTLVEDETDPDMVTLGPDDSTVDKVATLSATLVQTPATWSKTRGDVRNIVKHTYVTSAGGPPLRDAETVTKNGSSIARFGPTQRDVATYLQGTDTSAIVAAYGDPAPGSLNWSVPSLQVRPGLMDDDELDQLAPIFYPNPEPVRPSVAGQFIILTDIDETAAVAGTDVPMQIIGCSFNVSGGRLSITPSVRAVPPADFATSITWADLGASPLADTFWRYPSSWADVDIAWTAANPGTSWTEANPSNDWTEADPHHLDPSLDWDELTYTDA